MSAESDKMTFYIKQSGNTLGAQLDFIERLKQRCHLRQVYSEEECDVIFAFVPIASRAGTDIETALKKITETSKPILLVAFHHTFDSNYIAPESRWSVKREEVFAVDILFNEDEGLIRWLHNDLALKSTTEFLTSVRAPSNILQPEQTNIPSFCSIPRLISSFCSISRLNSIIFCILRVICIIYSISRFISSFCSIPRLISGCLTKVAKFVWDALVHILSQKAEKSKAIRFHKMVFGNDMNSHQDFLRSLGINSQNEVLSVDQSDVIIAFVVIVSRAGTDIEAALKYIPENQPVVLVVLHRTFDPDSIAPESRRHVSKKNIWTVDCLFHEDQGLLKCHHNTKALEATRKYFMRHQGELLLFQQTIKSVALDV
ncbi:uncharacterized protein LOC124379732 isoform X2 [Silurus meridionalis]|uniref:uncharacterized protein LOC124379732 isoform X2 n=1 Tax=Silurus meridionalis TaxID=175797 RepID=UPI001EEA6D69|nr:uncharacterized protein LOC124379732 isoform X2 [Silurus meridionalis]